MIAILMMLITLFSDYPERISENSESFQLMFVIEVVYTIAIIFIILSKI